MNKEEINTVTIPLETYMDLIQRAKVNEMIMDEIRNCITKMIYLEKRLFNLESKVQEDE